MSGGGRGGDVGVTGEAAVAGVSDSGDATRGAAGGVAGAGGVNGTVSVGGSVLCGEGRRGRGDSGRGVFNSSLPGDAGPVLFSNAAILSRSDPTFKFQR